jgi:hypothetical protein
MGKERVFVQTTRRKEKGIFLRIPIYPTNHCCRRSRKLNALKGRTISARGKARLWERAAPGKTPNQPAADCRAHDSANLICGTPWLSRSEKSSRSQPFRFLNILCHSLAGGLARLLKSSRIGPRVGGIRMSRNIRSCWRIPGYAKRIFLM